MDQGKLTRRHFLRMAGLGAIGTLTAACAPATPVVIEKEVIKEVPVEKAVIVEKEVPKEIIKEVPVEVEKVVEKEVVREVEKVVTPTAMPPVKATLRWLDWSDQDECVNAAIEAFQVDYPGVTINFEPIGDGWGDKQLTQMVAGTAPDLLTGNDETSYIWAERDQLLDLNPLVDQDLSAEQIDDFFTYQWEGLIYPGTGIRLGLPYYPWFYQYYYNKDAFDEAGLDYPGRTWTVDDYSLMLEELTEKDASGKVTRWGGIEACYGTFRFGLWLHMFEGNMVDPEDWTHCAMSSEEAQAALEWHRLRLWDTNTLAQAMQVENTTSLDLIATGKVSLQGQGAGDEATLLANPPGFEWAIMTPPVGPTGKRTGIGTVDNWGIWSGTKYPDVAWEFLKLLALEDQFERCFSGMWSVPPNRKSLLFWWKGDVAAKYPGLKDDQIDPQLEQLSGDFVEIGEQFKRHKASTELIEPAMQKILQVGDADTSIMEAVCEEVTALNREEA
jgi:multiple sugar transport system substrate-binding protein